MLARKGLGRTSPNPMVGAVIVSHGRIIAQGWHKAAGLAHAEADALAKVNGKAPGATMYVNLEPCIHYGRTAPCSPAIAKAGIKRVVIGTQDPNPLVAGKGIEYLRAHGVQTDVGVLKDQAKALNRAFFKYITTGMPWVVLKMAMTLDGAVADRWGGSKYLSNAESLRWVHRRRTTMDAVLVGAGTVIADDPMLTPRLVKVIKQPLRVILDGRLRISPHSRLVKSAGQSPVLIYHHCEDANQAEALRHAGCELVSLPRNQSGFLLVDVLKDLGRRNIQNVLVEGGPQVASAFLQAGLWDELAVFVTPKIAADAQAVPVFAGIGPRPVGAFMGLHLNSSRRLGDDVLLTYTKGA